MIFGHEMDINLKLIYPLLAEKNLLYTVGIH